MSPSDGEWPPQRPHFGGLPPSSGIVEKVIYGIQVLRLDGAQRSFACEHIYGCCFPDEPFRGQFWVPSVGADFGGVMILGRGGEWGRGRGEVGVLHRFGGDTTSSAVSRDAHSQSHVERHRVKGFRLKPIGPQ